MVWAEIPVVNTVGDEGFAKHALQVLRDMIRRDRNHPSILVWGVGNEYYRAFFPAADTKAAYELTKQTAALARQLDPGRPTIQAQNDLVKQDIMALTDVQGRNRYFGWYEGSYAEIGHILDEEHRQHPDWKLVVSEYGAEAKHGYHVANPKLFDHSETYQLAFHQAYWDAIGSRDFVAGGFLWNMFDFGSFTKIGNAPGINAKGTSTFDRRPKDLYYYCQSVWRSKPMVYIRSHTQPVRRLRAGQPHRIELFSNCDRVELFIDGASQGIRTRAQGWVWDVALQPGAHTITATGSRMGFQVQDELSIQAVAE